MQKLAGDLFCLSHSTEIFSNAKSNSVRGRCTSSESAGGFQKTQPLVVKKGTATCLHFVPECTPPICTAMLLPPVGSERIGHTPLHLSFTSERLPSVLQCSYRNAFGHVLGLEGQWKVQLFWSTSAVT